MQIIHFSKVNKTDQDLYFYVDKDQSVDRDFILEREGRGGGETREREREMIKREREIYRRSRKIRGYKDVNHNPPKSQTQRLPVVMIFFFVQNRKV